MSDPKLISPLLDGFMMGAPMSDHHGVRCCPAMKENSDDKYIVKVISVPASQVQLDALLLTGAYKDSAAATAYFKTLADDITREAETLQKLSKLEGFLAFEGCQVVPMEDNCLGYDVYLLSSYKRSLEKFIRRNPMTHLSAVNLGLDMCAALAICRNAGYLYVDLKPGNIFISEDKEFRIGDLGLMSLRSLKYSSLPAKYCSPYAPPELHDPMTTLNTTADTFAAGMILYQVYNNGTLPFEGKAPGEPLPSPLNADYEIAEIIMKAIDPEPTNRWKNPMEMGQALVAYMQRNVINDDPINPPLVVTEPLFTPDPEPAAEPDAESTAETDAQTADKSAVDTEAEPEIRAEPCPGESVEESSEIPEDLAFLEEMVSDETAPDEADAAEADAADVTEEVSSILAQADELIGEDAPQPEAEAPEATTPVAETEEEPKDDRSTMVIPASEKPRFKFFQDDEEDYEDEYYDDGEDAPQPPAEAEAAQRGSQEQPDFESVPKKKKKNTGLIVLVVLLALLACLAVGAWFFYTEYYILEVDSLNVTGVDNSITVTIDTEIDTSILTVICSDSYGNTRRSTISDGTAVFEDLNPNTMYQIYLEAEGFHRLIGATKGNFTTAAKTEILNLSVVTGNDDGTAVLSFSIEGPEADWNLICSAEDEEDRVITFTGHTVNITGLTVGKTYTFTLEPTTELYMTCPNSIEFNASRIILAENLAITSCGSGKLTAQWEAPEDAEVESWTVVCYNDAGQISTITTQDTNATFENIDTNYAYTVEVTAAGMTQVVRASITANAVTVNSISVRESGQEELVITWDYEGNDPANGWLLMYTVDNSSAQEVIRTDSPSATIAHRIPDATYHFTLLTADAVTIFSNTLDYTCSGTTVYFNNEMKLDFEYVTAHLLVTPSGNWDYRDVETEDYTDTFKVGQEISILLKAESSLRYWVKNQDLSVLYVVRDAEGNVVYELTEHEKLDWFDLWMHTNNHYHSAELNLPDAPDVPGKYTLAVYIDGYQAVLTEFTITE